MSQRFDALCESCRVRDDEESIGGRAMALRSGRSERRVQRRRVGSLVSSIVLLISAGVVVSTLYTWIVTTVVMFANR